MQEGLSEEMKKIIRQLRVGEKTKMGIASEEEGVAKAREVEWGTK